VARELKYSSPGLDADALQRELAGVSVQEPENADDEFEDEYDDYRRR